MADRESYACPRVDLRTEAWTLVQGIFLVNVRIAPFPQDIFTAMLNVNE